MFETYYKVEKKVLKKFKSDLEAIIMFEKRLQKIMKDKNIPEDVKKKLSVSTGLLEGAENNTKRTRSEVMKIIKNKRLIVKD